MDQFGSKSEFARYVAGFNRRLVLPWTGLVGLRLSGFKLYEVYTSQKKQVETAQQMDAMFDADFTGIMDDGIICSETLGMEIRMSDYDFPAVAHHPIKNRKALSRLRLPDPNAGGRMSLNLESIRALSQTSDKPVAISIEGPFTLAAQLAGVEDLARSVITDPGFALLLLEFTAQTVKVYAHAAANAGATLVSLAEPTSIILSPEQFNTYVVPGIRTVLDGLDAWKVMHVCGDTSHLLDRILSCGIQGISLDQVMDIPELMPAIPGDVVVFGNIDPIDVMLEMDASGVAEKTKLLLAAVADYPNFIMSTGCDCVLETPYENLKALIETTHTYPVKKKYPKTRIEGARSHPPSIHQNRKTAGQPCCSGTVSHGVISQIRKAVVEFMPDICRNLCEKAIETGISPSQIMDKGLAAGMEQAGDLFTRDIYFIPELLRCTDTLYAGLDIIKPHLAPGPGTEKINASLMIGVVAGDIHEIGKNLVIAMFAAAGWEIHDLGTDVSADRFVEAYMAHKPSLVGISALMNTSMRGIENVVTTLKACDPDVRVMVGGAPLDEKKALAFGAHGYAPNAVRAVEKGDAIIRT